jgi:zinc protease
MMAKKTRMAFSLVVFTFLYLGQSQQNMAGAQCSVHRLDLRNRLTLVVCEEQSLPFVTFQLLLDAGAWRDAPGREGLANLTSQALLLGTKDHPAAEIEEELDFMGSELSASCSRDFAAVSLRTLKKHLEPSFRILFESITQPAFPEEETARKVKETIGAIQSSEDDPGEVAERAFRRALFTKSPYAHPIRGNTESVSGFTRQTVLDFYEQYYRPDNAVLAIVGDITVDEVEKQLVPQLLKWAGGTLPETKVAIHSAEGPAVITIDRPITQANIILGHRGIERENRDYHAISVMNSILGSGFGSRLLQEIRVKRGLAYSVASMFIPHKHAGAFQIILQTQNSTAREAIAIARQEMKRMQEEFVSEDELETAKKYLVGSFPLRFDTQRSLAALYSQMIYYDLGLDYPERYPSLVNTVSREDVQRVAREYLDPDNSILSVVADLEKAGIDGS